MRRPNLQPGEIDMIKTYLKQGYNCSAIGRKMNRSAPFVKKYAEVIRKEETGSAEGITTEQFLSTVEYIVKTDLPDEAKKNCIKAVLWGVKP